MHCSNAQQQLDQALANAVDSDESTLDSELQAHLQTCESCTEHYRSSVQELELKRLLANDQIPPMRSGFADQALARAWELGQHQPAAKPTTRPNLQWAGMAASLLLGVLLVNHWLINDPSDVSSAPSVASQEAPLEAVNPAAIAKVEMAPATTRNIQVRLVSKEALPNATISIRVEGNVALTGYPENQPLRWDTAIAAGNNQLALPISLKGGADASAGGTVVIEVRSGDASKAMRFTVAPEAAVAAADFPVYLASI